MLDAGPEDWKTFQLRDLFRQRKERGYDGLPIASVGIESGLTIRSTAERRVESALKNDEHNLAKENDIVYNMMRMWQGACGLAKSDCVVSPAYVVMTPTPSMFPEFALEMLRSPATVKLLHAYSQGIVEDRLRLYPDSFGQIAVSVPPLEEQKRIASVLQSVDASIAATQAVTQQTEALWRGLTETLIWSLEERSEACARPLGTVLHGTDYGVNVPLTAVANGHPVLRMGNIQDGRIDLSDLKWGEICAADAAKLALNQGDILFNRTNSKDLVGKVAFVHEATKCLYASYIVRLSVDKRIADPYYLFAAMHSNRMQRRLRAISTPGVSQSNINPTNLKQQLVPLPPLAVQRTIAEKLRSVEEAKFSSRQELAALQAMKENLSANLLTGRIRVLA